MKARRIFEKALSGSKNIRFDDFVKLIEAFGFVHKRTRGSHRIFKHPDVPELLSVQPSSRHQVKPYQIRQFLAMVEEHDLTLPDGETEDTDQGGDSAEAEEDGQ